ncbi:MAG: universal stress protein [Chloroflexota bacterium]
MSSDGGVRILFATDGSDGAAAALDFLMALPLRPSDEVLVVSYPAYFLAARPDSAGLIASLMEGRRRAARGIVDAAVKRLAQAGVPAAGTVQEGLEAVDAILRVAGDRHADVIVLGSRGRGPVSSLLLGSTARALAMLSVVPVLVVHERSAVPRRVLIAVDGSAASRAAIALFARLPLPNDVSIELLHVLASREWSEIGPGRDGEIADLRESVERDEAELGQKILRDAAAQLGGGRTVSTRAASGPVSDTILARAEEIGADLVVLGSRGVAGPRRLLWGSTAERVTVAARCAVLIAPVPQVTATDGPEKGGSRDRVGA